MRLYCVYDAAANAFMPPFAMRADAEARRSFEQACVDDKHAFSRSLKDYSLWLIGEFSEVSAKIEPIIPPKAIAKAEEFAAARAPAAGNS